MLLKRLSLINFKNYSEADIEFGSGANAFVGDNGSGKTNLLDAIHYLALCKSYFNPIDSQNILFDEAFFMVQGWFENEGKTDLVHCGVKKNQKKQFLLNKEEYARLADHIGMIPLVMISPTDNSLITEGSEERRKLMDSIISQYDRTYLDNLISYNKALQQRNALLKSFSRSHHFDAVSLEIWDDQLINYGAPIYQARQSFLEKLNPIFLDYYNRISGGKENVSVDYESALHEEDLGSLLKAAISRDRSVEHTTKGIHKDDLLFKLAGQPVKKFGSQGQQKSFILALKLAEYEFFGNVRKLSPLLLLDDIFDKLDDSRVTALMELVSKEGFGQIFITDAHPERIKSVFNHIGMPLRVFEIEAGDVKRIQIAETA